MSYQNTIMNQVLHHYSRHDLEMAVKAHHNGRKPRRFSFWNQFATMTFSQLASRNSLRDIESTLTSHNSKWYHVGGASSVKKSTLADANATRNYKVYEELFFKAQSRFQNGFSKHRFKFKNKLFSLDSSTIDLCLSLMPWAKFRQTKGGIKLHTLLDHDGYIPSFISITDAKTHDVKEAKRKFVFKKGSITAMDRGYVDFTFLRKIDENGAFFVTRLKSNTRYKVVSRNKILSGKGVTSDQIIQFTTYKGEKSYPKVLRRVRYVDEETGQAYEYITNHFKLSSVTIAGIYKDRWQVELFFKWIKQHLKIKTFVGTSKNAVMTQIWIAMCTFLLLAYLSFKSKVGNSILNVFRLIQIQLFHRKDLLELIGEKLKPKTVDLNKNQLKLRLT